MRVVDEGWGADREVAGGAGMHRDERGGWVIVENGLELVQMMCSGQRGAAALGYTAQCARLSARGSRGEGRSDRARRLGAGERSQRARTALRKC